MKRIIRLVTFVSQLFMTVVISAQEKLPSPPMGWNSFDSYGVYLHENAALDNLRELAEKYKPFGYDYFIIDNGWFGEYKLKPGTMYAIEKHASDVRINEYGLLQPSVTYFPNGFGQLIDECHREGLKFGVHLMRGIPRKAVLLNTPIKGTSYHARDIVDTVNICRWCEYNYGVDMSKPGAQDFYNSLINQLADWGVDFIKYDDIVPYPQEIEAVVKAIADCGRRIVLSLSPGGTVLPQALDCYRKADMLRVTHDIWDNRQGINSCFTAWKKWEKVQMSGLWIDMDMIPFGSLQLMSPKGLTESEKIALAGLGNTRKSRLTEADKRTFITLRALFASPLIIGGDLPTMDDYSYQLLTNRDMIHANQNGVMGKLVYEENGVLAWNTSDRTSSGGWYGVFNTTGKSVHVTLSLDVLSCYFDCQYLHDIWNNEDLEVTDDLTFEIPPYDVVFMRYE